LAGGKIMPMTGSAAQANGAATTAAVAVPRNWRRVVGVMYLKTLLRVEYTAADVVRGK